jgi:phage terminase large subunit-like protein
MAQSVGNLVLHDPLDQMSRVPKRWLMVQSVGNLVVHDPLDQMSRAPKRWLMVHEVDRQFDSIGV